MRRPSEAAARGEVAAFTPKTRLDRMESPTGLTRAAMGASLASGGREKHHASGLVSLGGRARYVEIIEIGEATEL